MKFFIISDIHGSAYYTEKALEKFRKSQAEYLIILGDILYHGARNELPEGYSPKKVTAMLNEEADRIIAVRGNCDSEVDGVVLDFPIMSVYSNIILEDRRIFLTHGHLYNEENMVRLPEGSCFLYGHTHLPRAEFKNGIYFLNPGSTSRPKGGYKSSYAVLDKNIYTIYDFDDNIIDEIKMEE